MTTRFSRKLLALFTTIALIASPAAALASGNPQTTDHHSHSRHVSERYVLGNNWQTPDHHSNRHFTTLHHLDLIVARSI